MSEARIIPLHAGIQVSGLRPINKGSLIAEFAITVPVWQMKIRCLWIKGEHGEFVGLPGKWVTARSGKEFFVRLVGFADKEARNRFQDAVLDAVKQLAKGYDATRRR